MTLKELLEKKCVVKLNYFDVKGDHIKSICHAGVVIHVDGELGISVVVESTSDQSSLEDTLDSDDGPIFLLPSTLSAWQVFDSHAAESSLKELADNPEYCVQWDIHQNLGDEFGGSREWWEWRPASH